MSSEPVTTSDLATLSAWRAQRETVVRWLRRLVPLLMAVVIWAALNTRPRPGLGHDHLAVSVALAAFVAAGLGVLATVRRPGTVHYTLVAVLSVASVVLAWVQPDGAGVAGIFLALSLLAPLVRAHGSVPLAVLGLVVLAVMVSAAHHGSVVTALLDAIMIGAFYGMLFLAMRLGEANRLAERLLAELERSRAAQARVAGLAERQRLAREMHDVLAHSLSGLMLQLEGARMLAAAEPDDPRLPEVINRAHQLARNGLEEARRAIGTLRGDDLPGPERLPDLAARFEQDQGIPCRFTVRGEQRPLGSEARLALYRVAQEALTNVIRHARAERVELRLVYGPSTARLTVEDFAPATPADDRATRPRTTTGGGYGLTGMRERAELLGGTLTTGSVPGGFRVELEIPI